MWDGDSGDRMVTTSVGWGHPGHPAPGDKGVLAVLTPPKPPDHPVGFPHFLKDFFLPFPLFFLSPLQFPGDFFPIKRQTKRFGGDNSDGIPLPATLLASSPSPSSSSSLAQ